MDENEGYGKCDELGTGGSCKDCTVRPVPGEDRTFNRLKPVEEPKTQPVRVWMTDLDVLQQMKESEDETPGSVIHRVLIEYNNSNHGNQSAAQQYIKKLNTIIENQTEENKTLRREIAERDDVIEDIMGESLIGDEGDPDPRKIYDENGVTVNITVNRGSE